MSYKCEVHKLPAKLHRDPTTGRVLMTCERCVEEQARRVLELMDTTPRPTRWTTKLGLIGGPTSGGFE